MSFIPTLIETMRLRGGHAPLWYLHLRRLSESCRALGVPFPRTMGVPSGVPDRVRRLEVGTSGTTVTERPFEDVPSIRLVTARTRHEPYPHKITARAQFDAAGGEARTAGTDDALMLTATGEVAECGVWGIFWWEGSRVAGPPMSLGILRSVARMRLEELGGPVVEQALGRAQLAGRSLFVANAVRGVVPVAVLDGEMVPAAGQTAALAARFWP
jgi:branched-subunit amino acid aminotransferase/4-amino-4-deoxychorismate lyase